MAASSALNTAAVTRSACRADSSDDIGSASASIAGGVDRNASGSALGDRTRVAASTEPADNSLLWKHGQHQSAATGSTN